jgi:predicted secreted protein
MSVAGGIVIFVIIWWCVLFTVLPIGVRNAYEDGVELVPGQADGAPVKPRILYKFGLTTIITTVIFGLIWASDFFGWVDWRQLMYDIAEMT